jgi:acyl carrier protein
VLERYDERAEKRFQRIEALEKLGCTVIRAPEREAMRDEFATIAEGILRQSIRPANIISILPFLDSTKTNGTSPSSTILDHLAAVKKELAFLKHLQVQLKPSQCLLISPNSPHSLASILPRARALMIKGYCEQNGFEGRTAWRAIQLDVSLPPVCTAASFNEISSPVLDGLHELLPAILSTDEHFYHARLTHNNQTPSRASAIKPQATVTSAPHTRPNIMTPYEQPRTALERRVADIWEEILGIEKVGVTDDFFKLGGHSLLATQLISRLRREFEVNISMSLMLETPTIANLAQAIENLLEDDQVSSDNLAEVLSVLEKLPPEEALALLDEREVAGAEEVE